MKEKTKRSLISLSELISLRNKKALITGSGTGIGEAIANRFAEAGADLELVDINEERLKKVKEELMQFSVGIDTNEVDLSKKEQIDALWKKL
jgi:short-subunit dehydrogenase